MIKKWYEINNIYHTNARSIVEPCTRDTPPTEGGGAWTMETVALSGSISDRIVSPFPSLFTICGDNVTAETFIRLSNREG